MTAEVAILNNQGVAIAADSAVTIGLWGEKKIYYTAEKIFSVSKKHPIGIMIHSQADFMGINWKILINEYSKELGERVFDKLEDYMKHFIVFLSEFKYIKTEKQKEYLEYICMSTFSVVKKYYEGEQSDKKENDNDLTKQEKTKLLSSVIKKRNEELEAGTIVFQDFSGDFIKSNTELVKNVAKKVFDEIQITEKQIDELIALLMLDAQKLESSGLFRYSGIVMVGYGEREIFPSVCSTRIFGRLGNDLIHEAIDSEHITDEGQSLLVPYAQTDVINTFIRGIDSGLQYKLTELFFTILKKIGLDDDQIEQPAKFFLSNLDQMKTELYRDPILEIVASLPVINLAEMAEALINITSLRRHVSTDSDTVGGPTDVAIISKVDGFVWVKRKNNLSI
jgi:hypothetical protein